MTNMQQEFHERIQNISAHISFLRVYLINSSQKRRQLRQSLQSILIYDICRSSETTIIIANTTILIALRNIMTTNIGIQDIPILSIIIPSQLHI